MSASHSHSIVSKPKYSFIFNVVLTDACLNAMKSTMLRNCLSSVTTPVSYCINQLQLDMTYCKD